MTLAIGIDLGATNLRAALVDTLPRSIIVPDLRGERKRKLPATDPDTVVSVIAKEVAAIVAEAPEALHAPVGIGIAAMLRGDTGIVDNAPNLGWRNVDFLSMLRARTPGHRFELANDVNAIAFGEYCYGAGRGARDILCVFVGTGIGGGIVAGGVLVKGASHIAGEIGHSKVVLDASARPCGCGLRGCIEAYASGKNLARRAREEVGAGASPQTLAFAGSLDALHGGHIDQAARAGDRWATALWDEIAPLFGAVLANAVTLLNPGRLILGGSVVWGTPELMQRTRAAYERFVNVPSGAACTMVEAQLSDTAGILGSAALAALATA
jgi:glucokinase